MASIGVQRSDRVLWKKVAVFHHWGTDHRSDGRTCCIGSSVFDGVAHSYCIAAAVRPGGTSAGRTNSCYDASGGSCMSRSGDERSRGNRPHSGSRGKNYSSRSRRGSVKRTQPSVVGPTAARSTSRRRWSGCSPTCSSSVSIARGCWSGYGRSSFRGGASYGTTLDATGG